MSLAAVAWHDLLVMRWPKLAATVVLADAVTPQRSAVSWKLQRDRGKLTPEAVRGPQEHLPHTDTPLSAVTTDSFSATHTRECNDAWPVDLRMQKSFASLRRGSRRFPRRFGRSSTSRHPETCLCTRRIDGSSSRRFRVDRQGADGGADQRGHLRGVDGRRYRTRPPDEMVRSSVRRLIPTVAASVVVLLAVGWTVLSGQLEAAFGVLWRRPSVILGGRAALVVVVPGDTGLEVPVWTLLLAAIVPTAVTAVTVGPRRLLTSQRDAHDSVAATRTRSDRTQFAARPVRLGRGHCDS